MERDTLSSAGVTRKPEEAVRPTFFMPTKRNPRSLCFSPAWTPDIMIIYDYFAGQALEDLRAY